MNSKRYLIVNADDFGLSSGVNRGIIEAHERGIVTSTSLMVRWPAAAEAAAYAQVHPSFSLGLHFDLGEWVYRHEAWVPVYEVIPTDNAGAVVEEVARQLDTFRRLVGGEPTHIDSHQHVHRGEPLRSVLIEVARELKISLRNYSSGVLYCGYFYGQTGKGSPLPDAISVDALIKILMELSPGVTELGCHPGVHETLASGYRSERAQEVKVLCDPRVRAAIVTEGIELRPFGSMALDVKDPA